MSQGIEKLTVDKIRAELDSIYNELETLDAIDLLNVIISVSDEEFYRELVKFNNHVHPRLKQLANHAEVQLENSLVSANDRTDELLDQLQNNLDETALSSEFQEMVDLAPTKEDLAIEDEKAKKKLKALESQKHKTSATSAEHKKPSVVVNDLFAHVSAKQTIIVDPANPYTMNGKGGISGALKKMYKSIGKENEYIKDLLTFPKINGKRCPNGEIRRTSTADIDIIHTSVPDLRQRKNRDQTGLPTEQAKQKMFDAYYNTFVAAAVLNRNVHNKNPKTLSCPLLGAGIFKWDQKLSAEIAGNAYQHFREKFGDILEVNFYVNPSNLTETQQKQLQQSLDAAVKYGMKDVAFDSITKLETKDEINKFISILENRSKKKDNSGTYKKILEQIKQAVKDTKQEGPLVKQLNEIIAKALEETKKLDPLYHPKIIRDNIVLFLNQATGERLASTRDFDEPKIGKKKVSFEPVDDPTLGEPKPLTKAKKKPQTSSEKQTIVVPPQSPPAEKQGPTVEAPVQEPPKILTEEEKRHARHLPYLESFVEKYSNLREGRTSMTRDDAAIQMNQMQKNLKEYMNDRSDVIRKKAVEVWNELAPKYSLGTKVEFKPSISEKPPGLDIQALYYKYKSPKLLQRGVLPSFSDVAKNVSGIKKNPVRTQQLEALQELANNLTHSQEAEKSLNQLEFYCALHHIRDLIKNEKNKLPSALGRVCNDLLLQIESDKKKFQEITQSYCEKHKLSEISTMNGKDINAIAQHALEKTKAFKHEQKSQKPKR